MRFSLSAAAIAALPLAAAHYTFSGLTINGTMVGRDWQYVREHTRGYMPTFQQEAATSNDFRCQPGAATAGKTEVYTVRPGDVVGLRQAFGAGGMKHPGPAQVYVSKAPSSVKEYGGEGDWVKMSESLVCKSNPQPKDFQNDAWCSWGESIIDFTVSDTLPEGEYLVRAEHIALHGAHDGKAEFYYACAQIKIEGTSATEVPGDKVKFPGVYKVGDKAHNFSVWGRSTSYDTIPGPAVAPGGTFRGSTDGSSSAKVVVGGGSTGSKPSSGTSTEAAQPTTPPTTEKPQESAKPEQPSTQPETPVQSPETPGDYPEPPTDYPEVTPTPQPSPEVPSPQPEQPQPEKPTDPVAPVQTEQPENPPCPASGNRRKGRKGRKGAKKIQYRRGAHPRVFRA